MSKNSVLVLGGGVGGIVASSLLSDKVKDKAALQLIERKKTFDFPPSYPWLMLGMRKPSQVQKNLNLLKRKKEKIDILNDEVISIDVQEKSVLTSGSGKLPFDYLVIALGAEYSPNAIPGFLQHARHIYDLESALKFREVVEAFNGGRITVGVARTPFKCPAAPYEVALLLDDYYRKKGIRDKVRFDFFTPESMPVPAVGPEVSSRVLELLRSREIQYHPKLRVSEIKSNELIFESGEKLSYDMLFCVPPHAAPKPVVEAGLTDETGWIPVNPGTLETKHEGIYAVGDVTSLPTPKGYTPFLPKAGVFAHGEAEVVANNIAVGVTGRGKAKVWDGEGACFLEIGKGQSAFVKGKFLAEPKPEIEFHMPGRVWHMEKVAFEKYWMHHWF